MVKRLLLGLLMLFIGVIGIVPFFVIGEGTGSGIAAYATVTLLFAVLAYVLSRSDPGPGPIYAVLLSAPVLLLSILGPDSGGAALSIIMLIITLAAAILGAGAAAAKHGKASEEPASPPK